MIEATSNQFGAAMVKTRDGRYLDDVTYPSADTVSRGLAERFNANLSTGSRLAYHLRVRTGFLAQWLQVENRTVPSEPHCPKQRLQH